MLVTNVEVSDSGSDYSILTSCLSILLNCTTGW